MGPGRDREEDTVGEPDDARVEQPLRRLFRAACAEESPDFVRPSEESIAAFARRKASEAQRTEVLSALAKSAEFRQEIVELTSELEALQDPDVLRALEAARMPQQVRAAIQAARADETRASRAVTPHPESFFDRLRHLVWQPAFAYAAAAVVLIAGGLLGRLETGGPLLLRTQAVRLPPDDAPRDVAPSHPAAPPTEIPLAPGLEVLDLWMDEPVPATPDVRYKITIRGAHDEILASSADYRVEDIPGRGAFLHFLLDVRRLEPGTYQVLVDPLRPDGTRSPDLEPLSLTFRLVRPASR